MEGQGIEPIIEGTIAMKLKEGVFIPSLDEVLLDSTKMHDVKVNVLNAPIQGGIKCQPFDKVYGYLRDLGKHCSDYIADIKIVPIEN